MHPIQAVSIGQNLRALLLVTAQQTSLSKDVVNVHEEKALYFNKVCHYINNYARSRLANYCHQFERLPNEQKVH